MSSISSTGKNTSSPNVYIGLSGGVDSAVAAALLQAQGYEVTAVFIRIVLPGYPCTAGEDRLDAMRAAAHLGLPFRTVDLSSEYEARVFQTSLREFGRGRTPNPDSLCNREIKFGLFFDWCMRQGAEFVATGHYARVEQGMLYTAADAQKDQSYFLALVPQQALHRTLFPLAHMQKAQVRAKATKLGLPNAQRKDSQGLCFLGPVSLHGMLERELNPVPGLVLDEAGKAAGSHRGALLYTPGQRHGFAVARTLDGKPRYVTSVDAARNTITVSPHAAPAGASRTRLSLRDVNWIGERGEGPYLARYRYRQPLIPARVEHGAEKSVVVMLEQPHYVPLGQVLALYCGERCVGGGIVDTAQPLS